VFEALDRVLREAGPRTRGVGLAVLRLGSSAAARDASGGLLASGGEVELPVLVTRLPGPCSYTGEDSIEIVVPGNPHVVERVMERLVGAGLSPARAGEFTARAYVGGRLGLVEAEAVGAMIAADTRERLDAARRLHDGSVGIAYRRFADEATGLLALVEAGIDFTDQEDVTPIAPAALSARLRALRGAIGEHLRAAAGEHARDALATVALVGGPNAGKSTLFNALLGRRRAVASPIAGTTRDVLREEMDLSRDVAGAGRVALMDLPGLEVGFDGSNSGGRSEVAAQHAARKALVDADVLVWCDPGARFGAGGFDGAGSVGEAWKGGKNLKPAWDRRGTGGARAVLRVRTCADRPLGHELPAGVLAVCALDGWNLSVLRRAIAEVACVSGGGCVAALVPRHRLALAATTEALDRALGLVAPTSRGSLAQPEAISQCLREAIEHLGELVGTITPEDVLGRIFATFCVGK
jgi:tRNA modification GTPase